MILISNFNREKYTRKFFWYKAIDPIKIQNPDAYILPERILFDNDIIGIFQELLEKEKILEKDITFNNINYERINL